MSFHLLSDMSESPFKALYENLKKGVIGFQWVIIIVVWLVIFFSVENVDEILGIKQFLRLKNYDNIIQIKVQRVLLRFRHVPF